MQTLAQSKSKVHVFMFLLGARSFLDQVGVSGRVSLGPDPVVVAEAVQLEQHFLLLYVLLVVIHTLKEWVSRLTVDF